MVALEKFSVQSCTEKYYQHCKDPNQQKRNVSRHIASRASALVFATGDEFFNVEVNDEVLEKQLITVHPPITCFFGSEKNGKLWGDRQVMG